MLYCDIGVTINYNAKDNTKTIGVLLISIVVLEAQQKNIMITHYIGYEPADLTVHPPPPE